MAKKMKTKIKKVGELRVRPDELVASFPPCFSNRYKEIKWEQTLRAHGQGLKVLDKEIVFWFIRHFA